jgi:hypothetical protein
MLTFKHFAQKTKPLDCSRRFNCLDNNVRTPAGLTAFFLRASPKNITGHHFEYLYGICRELDGEHIVGK